MNILIIGYGSIGQRHAKILQDMGHNVAVLSRRDLEFPNCFTSLKEALQSKPDYIIIATDTSDHYETFNKLIKAKYDGKLLIEKPVFASHHNIGKYPFTANVAYNLRFHPVVIKLHEELTHSKILSAHYYVGQHLASWRAGRNHFENYSAHKNKGGGVLRDLSHEFDLINLLFGKIKSHQSAGGRFGDVTVDSEDTYAFILQNEHCPLISLQMNYLDHVARREIIVNTLLKSYKADLVNYTLWIDDKPLKLDIDSNHSYKQMHQDILTNDGANACSLQEGLDIMSLIEEIET